MGKPPSTPVGVIARRIAELAGRAADEPLDDYQFNALLRKLEEEMVALRLVLALKAGSPP